jgi:hypothetical protein
MNADKSRGNLQFGLRLKPQCQRKTLQDRFKWDTALKWSPVHDNIVFRSLFVFWIPKTENQLPNWVEPARPVVVREQVALEVGKIRVHVGG